MRKYLLPVSSLAREHDSISTLSNCNRNVRDFCPCWSRMVDHAFQHVCCYYHWFSHAVTLSDNLFLLNQRTKIYH